MKNELIENKPASVPAPEDEPLYARAGFLLRRANQLSTALFAEICPEVTPRQFGALHILQYRDDLDQKGLAKLLFVDQTNIRVIVDGLEKKGLVRRMRPDEDRRSIRVQLSPKGRKIFPQIKKRADEMQRALLSNLSRAEQKQLLELLTKLTKG